MIPRPYNPQTIYNVRKNDIGMDASNSVLSQMFQRYLWRDVWGVIKFKIPKHWSMDYMLYVLYTYGYFAIVNTDKFGVIPQQCSPMGYNVFYEPTHVVISNPMLKGILTPAIGTQCAVVRIMPDWCGLYDIVSYYADLMAEMCSAVGVNVINSKLAYVLFGENKSTAETLKGIYQSIASGNPAVCVDKNIITPNGDPMWQLFDLNVSQHYITDKLLVDLKKVKNMFWEDIGIPNSNTEKKERMVTDEVNSNNAATSIGTDTMLDRINRCIDQARDVFPGLGLSAEWRYKPDEQTTDINNDTVQSKSDSVR